MTTAIELYCKDGHEPETIIIAGIGCPLIHGLAVNSQDKTEVRFRCRKCGLLFNKVEITGPKIIWNEFKKVGKLTHYDERGNIIQEDHVE